MFPKTSFILGGASSGKTAFAEHLVETAGGQAIYLATGQAFDGEMRAKIDAHRAGRGDQWRTVEAPLDAADRLGAFSQDDTVLLDCATLWLSNHLMADSDLTHEQNALLTAITTSPARLVVVSNEVGLGGVADTPLARQFANLQGRLNQRIAAQSDLVVAVMAGLPMALKGQFP